MATPIASPSPENRRIEIAPRTIFLLLGVVAGIWVLGQLHTVLTVVTIALVMVGTFDPLVAWLQKRGLGRGRALVLVFAVAGLAVIGVIVLMVPPLIAQLLALIEEAPKQRANLVHNLEGNSWAKPFVKTLTDLPVDDLGRRAATQMLGYSETMLEVVGYGISTLFLSIYLLADPARSKGLLYAVVPRHHHVKLAKVLLELKVIVGGYMRGQLITSLAIAVFVFILLTAFGAENALALALFAGITDIIPFVGGYVASAPVILAVIPSGTSAIIGVAALMVLYQEFESRILVPRVYGRTLRLPPAIVLVALLVGGSLAGIMGALLALPIAAGLQMVIRELRVDLPGESVEHDRMKLLDEQAVRVYEELTENVTAAEAGVIADDLASLVKRTEEGGPTLSAQMPVVHPPPLRRGRGTRDAPLAIMPDRGTKKRAKRDLRRGTSKSTAAGEFVREEIHHIREGKHGARSTKQAIAIGLAKARRAGVDPGTPKSGSRETKQAAARDAAAGKHPRKPSRTRSRASQKALKREPRRAASHAALARHAHTVAKRRGAAARSASARKAARTRAREAHESRG